MFGATRVRAYPTVLNRRNPKISTGWGARRTDRALAGMDLMYMYSAIAIGVDAGKIAT
eukprot:CAMPEP_0113553898 /NCGR_PEP_ID=MMETSP0015_2-20120614/15857_1 /TAXON_ID=2838 /ORGANISM="Odontella" /LENGTH=57 /DNA_ID=CAMNT_0000454995 /DNA_START=716 /DNA_END=885 /DNA_ORIENTATION=+ /assembly_acc=CAM_ASM_000160